MPSIQRKKVYSPLTDGLNDSIAAVLLREGEAAELLNCEVNERGILEKYKGYTKDHSPFPDDPDSFIRLLLNYKRGTSVDDLIMYALDDGNANSTFKVDGKKTSGGGTSVFIGHTVGTADFTNGNTAVAGTGTSWASQLKSGDKIKTDTDADDKYTEIASVTNDTTLVLIAGGYLGTTSGGAVDYTARVILNKDFVPRAIVFNNKAIIVNGSETPMTWDNSTISKITDTDAPKAKYIEAHKKRVFMASTSGSPSDIFWSAVNDESSWDAAAFEPIFPQDNGTIISVKSFGDSLIVLKNNGKIYQVIGNFDQTEIGEIDFIRKIDVPENIGIIPERSPVVHQGFLYFLTETGIYRIDQRMFVEKATFAVDTFMDSVSFALGPTSSKSHNLDTTVQWNTGTLSGIVVTAGKIKSIFDKFTVTDAKQQSGAASIAIDSSSNIHLAYLDSLDTKIIKYKKFDSSGVTIDETAVTTVSDVIELSIDVAPNGNVGIAYIPTSDTILRFVERTTTWSSEVTITGDVNFHTTVSLRYRTDNNPRIATISGFASGSNRLLYHTRIAGVFSQQSVVSNLITGKVNRQIDLLLTSSDKPRVIFSQGSASLKYIVGDGDFGTVTENKDVSLTSLTQNTRPYLSINSSGNEFAVFGDSGKIKRRDLDADTTTDLNTSNDHVIGYFIDPDDDKDSFYFLDSSGTESYTFETSTTITNSVTATGNTGSIFLGSRAYDSDNTLFVSVIFGANADELVIRRLAFRAVYTSQEFSDSTLAAWGTYDITGEVSSSATILNEVATNTVSPIPDANFKTITSGQVIESDSAKIFVKNRITFTLGAFAIPETDSVVMNYTGSGVDAKQVVGISFNNELFFGLAKKTATENNRLLISDIRDKILKTTHPVSSMEVYKNKLYAGLSTKGDLIILKQGFNFDGVKYDSDFQSKEDFLESIEQEKDGFKFYVLYEVKSLGSFDFSFRLNNFASSSDVVFQTTTIDQTKDGIAEIPIGDKFRSIQWRIENKNLDEQLGIIAVVIVFGTLNLR